MSKDVDKYTIVNNAPIFSENDKWMVIKMINDTDDASLAKINSAERQMLYGIAQIRTGRTIRFKVMIAG